MKSHYNINKILKYYVFSLVIHDRVNVKENCESALYDGICGLRELPIGDF